MTMMPPRRQEQEPCRWRGRTTPTVPLLLLLLLFLAFGSALLTKTVMGFSSSSSPSLTHFGSSAALLPMDRSKTRVVVATTRRTSSFQPLHMAVAPPKLDTPASSPVKGGDATATKASSTTTTTDAATDATLQEPRWSDPIWNTYVGPRIVLGIIAAVYGTNFPLGALMADNLPASAVTTSRMLIAAAALSPAILQLKPYLRWPAVLCGCFTAMGYVTQSLALVEVDPAKVSFLGAATVLWCPLLEAVIDKKPMGIKEAPQTWLAAVLCLAGVGILELYDPAAGASAAASTLLSVSTGDFLALLQAVGFGTGVFWTSKMLRRDPDQALPVTATLVATTSLLAVVWSLADGWMTQPNWQSMALPGMFFDPSMRPVAAAILWTGLISTSLNFFIELKALSRVNPSEASVILASEPLWAALFGAVLYGAGTLTAADSIGGALIIAACLVNALFKPETFGLPPPPPAPEDI